MDFEQHIDRAVAPGCLHLNSLRESLTINRMDHRNERSDILDFIGLEVADHMPLDVVWQSFVLGTKFLRTALAKDTLTRLVCLRNRLDGVGFRHRYERHPLRQRRTHTLQLTFY